MSKRLRAVGVTVLAALVAGLVVLVLTPESEVRPRTSVAPVVDDSAPSALFIGDSVPAGSGAATERDGTACLAARALGWNCNLDAQVGTGFVADGRQIASGNSPLIERLADTKKTYLADIIVIDAGRNDRHAPERQLKAAISTYLEAVRKAWPRAELVIIEPYFMDTEEPLLQAPVLAHLRAETARLQGHVLSPQADGWISPGAGGRYPDAEGHRQLARRLVAAIRDLGLAELEITDRPR